MSFDFGSIFKSVSPIAKDIFSDFAQKGTVDNVTWLGRIFAENEHTAHEADSLTDEVYSTVQRFSENMRSVDKFCAEGKNKEAWLQNFINSNTDLTPEQKGEYLSQANAALTLGNHLMEESLKSPQTIDITAEVNQLMQQDLPPVEKSEQWNRYTMNPIVKQIGQQAELMGANGALIPYDVSQVPSEEIFQQDLTEVERDSVVDEGLKLAATAAIKIGHAAGKIPFLPKAMPISAITNIACVGVESFKNIGRLATGKISPLQAVENIGRASIAAVADFCTSGLPAKLLTPIPVVGPALSVMVGGFLTQVSSQRIKEKLYSGFEKIRPVATKIVETVSNAAKAVVNTVKETAKSVWNFLFGD